MENAVDALKMAAAVLVFVSAISIAINSFTEVRVTATTILNNKDREYDYTYVETNNNGTERIVGLESIVPTIYKAYKENYKIIFDENILSEGVYKKVNEEGNIVPVYSIDLQNEVLGSDEQKEAFIMAILYGNKYDGFDNISNTFKTNMRITLNNTGIYDIMKNEKVKESIGIYYQEEIKKADDTASSDNNVPDANKTEKRIITYTKIQ